MEEKCKAVIFELMTEYGLDISFIKGCKGEIGSLRSESKDCVAVRDNSTKTFLTTLPIENPFTILILRSVSEYLESIGYNQYKKITGEPIEE